MYGEVIQLSKIKAIALKTHRPLSERLGSYRITTGTSAFSAHTNAITQPMAVHPRKKFRTRIAPASRLLRANAMIAGRKYRTNPKPKIGGKKNAKRCIAEPCHVHTNINTLPQPPRFLLSRLLETMRAPIRQLITHSKLSALNNLRLDLALFSDCDAGH